MPDYPYYKVSDYLRKMSEDRLAEAYARLKAEPNTEVVVTLVTGEAVRGRCVGGDEVLSDVALSAHKTATYRNPAGCLVLEVADPMADRGTLDRNGVRQPAWEVIPKEAILSVQIEE